MDNPLQKTEVTKPPEYNNEDRKQSLYHFHTTLRSC